jgi:phosphonate transport system substrate-binding protein
MKRHFLWIFGCLLMIIGNSFAIGQTVTNSKIYTVGITPQFEARKLFEIWRPILDAIEKESGLRFTLRGAPTINDYEQQYFSGQFDFAYVNPYMVGVKNMKGYIPLVRDHGNSLVGVLVVRKDSPIQSAKELDGKTVAFPAPDAVAACLMVRAKLDTDYGVHVVPRFVRSHDSVFLNVAVGEVDAAGGVKGTLERQPEEVRRSLRELLTTREVAAIPLVANPAVPEKIREKVRAAFLKLGATDAGKALLVKVPIQQIGAASMADYEPLRHMGLGQYIKPIDSP